MTRHLPVRSFSAIVAAAFVLWLPRIAAQTTDAIPAAPLAGTWNVSMHGGDHVIPMAMVLEQNGKKITGTITMMGTDVKLDGEFADGKLALTSNAELRMPVPAGAEPSSAKFKLDGKLNDDGTLAGTVAMPNGAMPWTAARLKVRPAPIAGPWTMSVRAGDSAMTMALVFKQDGRAVTGTLTSDHTGTLELSGTYVDGVLTFSTDSRAGAEAAHVNYSARMKADGTLAGDIAGPMGAFAWTAERVKK